MDNPDSAQNIITYNGVVSLRKSGDYMKAYEACLTVKSQDPSNQWVGNQLGWCLYDMMKANARAQSAVQFLARLKELADLGLSQTNFVLDSVPFQIHALIKDCEQNRMLHDDILDELFENVKEINFNTSSNHYSMLLMAFLKAKQWRGLKDFIEWWNIDNLKAADFQIFEFQKGRKLMSLAEKVYINYAKLLIQGIADGTTDGTTAGNFVEKLGQLAKRHPEYQYLTYFQAKLMMALGEKEGVVKILLPFVIRKQRDYWVWDILGDAVDDEDLMLSCYCKALSCLAKDDYLVKMHLKMCDVLRARALFNEARTEFHVAAQIYRKNGWRFPYQYLDYENESWYQNAVAKDNNADFYSANTQLAEQLLFSEKPLVTILITYVNMEKKMANFVSTDHRKGFFSFKKLPKKQWPKQDKLYVCRMDKTLNDEFAEVYVCEKLKSEESVENVLVRHVEGELKIIASGAGFVDDIFVQPSLLSNIDDRQQVKVKALLNYNKKKCVWGWSAVSIVAL